MNLISKKSPDSGIGEPATCGGGGAGEVGEGAETKKGAGGGEAGGGAGEGDDEGAEEGGAETGETAGG